MQAQYGLRVAHSIGSRCGRSEVGRDAARFLHPITYGDSLWQVWRVCQTTARPKRRPSGEAMMAGRTRRDFLTDAAVASTLLVGGCNNSRNSPTEAPTDQAGQADVTLRIGNVLADIANEHTISTIGYNGSVPGPLIRLR